MKSLWLALSGDPEKPPTKKVVRNLVKRSGLLSMRKGEATALSRAIAASRPQFERFCDNLEAAGIAAKTGEMIVFFDEATIFRLKTAIKVS